MKKIAVILSGCGYLDGSEIREAVGVLWALSSHEDVQVECYAPDMKLTVVNHLTHKETGETRNVLEESARIARGKVQSLEKLNPNDFAAIVMPGGFGAAKNLCDFAEKGAGGKVLPELAAILRVFYDQQKPIGAACIAPAVLGLTFRDIPAELTVGAESDASAELEKLGHRHVETKPNEIHIDQKHHFITTPAYMYDDALLFEIFEGIQKMVDEVVKKTKATNASKVYA